MPRVNEEYFVAEAAAEEVYVCASPGEYFGVVPIPTVIFWLFLLLAAFAIFAIHQIVAWLSTDPLRAFHLAKLLASGASTAWNTFRVILNGGNDVLTAMIPAANLAAVHIVQPIVFTSLDVISLVFTGNAYAGVIPDPKTFEGHVCDGTEASSAWCAVQAKYAENLNIVEAESSNVIQNNTALVMSTAQARRLQALSGQSLIGTLPIQPLLDIVEDITGIVIMVVGQFADLAAHVVWSVLHEIAVIVYNMIMTLVRVLSALVMQIFSLGIVQNLLRIGFDILMVLLIHVGLPLLTAALDLVLCLVNFIMPGTWPKQLECSALPSRTKNTPMRPCLSPSFLFVSQLNKRASRRTGTSVR